MHLNLMKDIHNCMWQLKVAQYITKFSDEKKTTKKQMFKFSFFNRVGKGPRQ